MVRWWVAASDKIHDGCSCSITVLWISDVLGVFYHPQLHHSILNVIWYGIILSRLFGDHFVILWCIAFCVPTERKVQKGVLYSLFGMWFQTVAPLFDTLHTNI